MGGFRVGDRVTVEEFGSGVVQFVGEHHEKGKKRVGVELDAPQGKSDGKFGGHRYFKCKKPHGVLVKPSVLTAEVATKKEAKKEKKSKKDKKNGKRKRVAEEEQEEETSSLKKKSKKSKKEKKGEKKSKSEKTKKESKAGGSSDGDGGSGVVDTAWNQVRFKGKSAEADAKKEKFLRMMGASKEKSSSNRGAGPAGGLLASLMGKVAPKSSAFKASGLFSGGGAKSVRRVDVNAGSRALNSIADEFEKAQNLEKQKRKQGGRMGFAF